MGNEHIGKIPLGSMGGGGGMGAGPILIIRN